MNKKTLALVALMIGLSYTAVRASASGLGIPKPVKKPISIREGSAKTNRRGLYRTRYFMGGGLLRGK